MYSVPVITYHSVRPDGKITPQIFESHMQWLKKHNYQTLHSMELYKHVTGENVINNRALQITFDDGWLDNWVYAFPILKKYNLKATIFVITDRIHKNGKNGDRPNMDDVWKGHAKPSDLPTLAMPEEAFFSGITKTPIKNDFLSWPEIKEMIKSGLIEIQSHSHHHSYYYKSPKVIDFNRLKHWKIAWATDGDFRFGIPEYEGASSLSVRRYYDPVQTRDLMFEYVKSINGEQILLSKGKKFFIQQCMSYYDSLMGTDKYEEEYESEETMNSRILDELRQSRNSIKKHTGIESNFLCWPWGDYSEISIKLAEDAGFKGAYSLDKGPNVTGISPHLIRRFESRPKSSFWMAARMYLYSSSQLASIYSSLYHRF